MAKQKNKSEVSQSASEKSLQSEKIPTKPSNNWIMIGLLLLLPWAIYYQTLNYGYVLDDQIVITDNSYTKKGFDGLWELLTTESFEGYFGGKRDLVQGNRYRPLSIMTFAVEIGLWGMKPSISHGINILLYSLTCLLLWFTLIKVLPKSVTWSWWVASIAALLYLVHPLHVEAVANIKGRDEIMAMLASVACWYLVWKYHESSKKSLLVWASVVFFLGLLSKENTITFLAVIPLALYFFTDRSPGYIFKTMLPLLFTTIAYLLLRFNTAGVPDFSEEIQELMNNPFLGMSASEKSATLAYIFLKYLKLSLVPWPLSHDWYPYAISVQNWSKAGPLIGLLIGLLLAAVALWKLRSKGLLAFCILSFFAMYSIVSNVVINVGTFMNDRFLFMASISIVLALSYVLWRLPDWVAFLPKSVAKILAVLITLIWGGLSYARVPVWENALALNTAAVKVAPGSARANSFMSTALFNDFLAQTNKAEYKHLLAESKIYSDKALEIYPTYGNGLTMRVGVASEYYKLDRKVVPLLDEFLRVIEVKPELPFLTEFLQYLNKLGSHDSDLVKFYLKAGNKLITQRKYDWAIHYLNMGAELSPGNTQIYQSIAEAYNLGGNASKAQEYLNKIR